MRWISEVRINLQLGEFLLPCLGCLVGVLWRDLGCTCQCVLPKNHHGRWSGLQTALSTCCANVSNSQAFKEGRKLWPESHWIGWSSLHTEFLFVCIYIWKSNFNFRMVLDLQIYALNPVSPVMNILPLYDSLITINPPILIHFYSLKSIIQDFLSLYLMCFFCFRIPSRRQHYI